MKKAAHILTDDKFLDAAIVSFAKIGVIENSYFCIKDVKQPFINIKNTENVTSVGNPKALIKLVNAGDFDIVFLHNLCMPPRFLLSLNANIKLVWITWGCDIYSDTGGIGDCKRLIRMKLYEPLTNAFVHRKSPPVKVKRDSTQQKQNSNRNRRNPVLWAVWRSGIVQNTFIEPCVRAVFNRLRNRGYSKFVRRVNYISTVLPVEYDIIKQHNPQFKAKRFYFSYARDNLKKYHLDCNAKDILIGNSCTLTNNHLDIFELLKSANITDRKWIIPLSYGDEGSYNAYLRDYFEKDNINGIMPLWDFMPRDEYFQTLSSCQYAIFGHKRQQAMANISQCIRNGCKIFLYKDSIAYQSLKQRGYILFTIDDDLNHEALNTPLTDGQKQHNKDIRARESNYETHIEKLRNAVKEVINDI